MRDVDLAGMMLRALPVHPLRGEERWSARLQAIVEADMPGGYSRLMDLDETGPARAPFCHATGRGSGSAGVRATASHSSGDGSYEREFALRTQDALVHS